MSIDLHTHTNFSDGSLSPNELINLAIEKGINVLGITDHDEVGSLMHALEYAVDLPIEIIPGVELSIEYNLPGQGHLHILGMFIDFHKAELLDTLNNLKQARFERIKTMVQKVEALGFSLDFNELQQNIGKGSAGRPHLAKQLIERGFVKDISEAFNKYLSKGRPAYVPKKKLTAQSAIDLIHESNGIAVLAHPFSLGFQTYPEMGKEILKLNL